MKRDILIEQFYPHPQKRVWQALTDPGALAAWFAENDFEPVVGHRFRFVTDPGPGFDGVLECEVTEVEEPARLAYTFRGGMMTSITTVTWTLTPREGGTLLRLEHTGFAGLRDVLISHIIGSGWGKFMAALPGVLDRLAVQGLRR